MPHQFDSQRLSQAAKTLTQSGLKKLGYELHRIGIQSDEGATAQSREGVVLNKFFNLLLESRAGSLRNEQRSIMNFVSYCLTNNTLTKSQLLQDLFVLFVLKERRGGYFVEFGATNGVDLNNTNLLERNFGWSGILAEPCKYWHPALQLNRHGAIDHRCVWSTSGEKLRFNETSDRELSKIGDGVRRPGDTVVETYEVETVSLSDLLRQHNAPRTIDYMSIDVEGSELAALTGMDFTAYDVSILTIEHNYSDSESLVESMLLAKGYVRAFKDISLFDGWYVKRTLAAEILSLES